MRFPGKVTELAQKNYTLIKSTDSPARKIHFVKTNQTIEVCDAEAIETIVYSRLVILINKANKADRGRMSLFGNIYPYVIEQLTFFKKHTSQVFDIDESAARIMRKL